MKEACTFYQFKENVSRSKILRSDRNPVRPKISKKAVCTHEDMAHRVNTIGPCPCEGDISKCEIPQIWE